VLQFDNPFEEGGVTKVEVVAPTAKMKTLDENEKEPGEAIPIKEENAENREKSQVRCLASCKMVVVILQKLMFRHYSPT